MVNYKFKDKELRELERRQREALKERLRQSTSVNYRCQACGATKWISYAASPDTGQIFILCPLHRIEIKLNAVIRIVERMAIKYQRFYEPRRKPYLLREETEKSIDELGEMVGKMVEKMVDVAEQYPETRKPIAESLQNAIEKTVRLYDIYDRETIMMLQGSSSSSSEHEKKEEEEISANEDANAIMMQPITTEEGEEKKKPTKKKTKKKQQKIKK